MTAAPARTHDLAPPGPKPLDVVCPRCHAPVGFECQTTTGFQALRTHAGRWRAVGVARPTMEDLERDYADYKNRKLNYFAALPEHATHEAKPNVCRSCGRPQAGRETRCPLCKKSFVPAEPCLDCDGKGIYPSGKPCTSCWNSCGLVPPGSNTAA